MREILCIKSINCQLLKLIMKKIFTLLAMFGFLFFAKAQNKDFSKEAEDLLKGSIADVKQGFAS